MNEDPAAAVARGSVLDDLYARLEGLELHLPALRERRSDIPALAEWFVGEFSVTMAYLRPPRLHRELVDLMLSYDWPHNVRQLRAVSRRIVLNAEGSSQLTVEHLRGTVLQEHGRARRLSDFSLSALEDFVRAHGDSKSLAAEALGCHRSSLHRRLEELRRDAAV
jgi:DNA-binding NtrC family response regulator